MPLRARLTAIFGALVLAPDTMLLRLSAFESSSEWLGSWGIVFYRAWGRLVFIPLMYVLANGGRSTAYLDAVRRSEPSACGEARRFTWSRTSRSSSPRT